VADQAIQTCSVLSVTVKAPAHAETIHLCHSVHLLYITVANGTFYTFNDMPLVREVDEIGDIIDPDPLDRFTFLPVGSELLDLRSVIGCYLVTPNAPLD
jgi:hypothetical protein